MKTSREAKPWPAPAPALRRHPARRLPRGVQGPWPVLRPSPVGEEEDSRLGDFIQDEVMMAPDDAASHELLKEQMQEVLDTLYGIYTDLDMQEQLKRIDKRYKELGMDN